eukprot:Opistho-2@74856
MASAPMSQDGSSPHSHTPSLAAHASLLDAQLPQPSPMVGVHVDGGDATAVYGREDPIQKHRSLHYRLLRPITAHVRAVLSTKKGRRLVFLAGVSGACFFLLFMAGHVTGSMAVSALSFFLCSDFLGLMTAIVAVWTSNERPSFSYSFGFHRAEVLAVFSSTIILSFAALYILKESLERILQPPVLDGDYVAASAAFGAIAHLFGIYNVSKYAHALLGTSSSHATREWVIVLGRRLIRAGAVSAGQALLARGPVGDHVLAGLFASSAVALSAFVAGLPGWEIADPVIALGISIVIIAALLPVATFNARILLQAAPADVSNQIDKCLREATTLEGVLELRNERFWMESYGRIAGSLQVRIRRDANERAVLAGVTGKLSAHVTNLTVQLLKDDWTLSGPMGLGMQ